MVAPVKVSLPPISRPVIDRRTGVMDTDWYNFFERFLNRTGGTTDQVASNANAIGGKADTSYVNAQDVANLAVAEEYTNTAVAAIINVSSMADGSIPFVSSGTLISDYTNFHFDDSTMVITVRGLPVVYVPQQTSGSFIGSLFLGTKPASLTHSSGTDGQTNVGIGVLSCNALTTGYDNVAIGYESAYHLTTGYKNFALGSSALSALTSGHDNVGIGYSACATYSDGAYNLGIGSFALAYGIHSSYSVAIGYAAGAYLGDGSTHNAPGSGNVYIGGLTQALATTEAQAIVIGYNVTSNGSHTTTIGNSSNTDNYLTGKIRVGGSIIADATGIHVDRAYTVATLPTGVQPYSRAFVTDNDSTLAVGLGTAPTHTVGTNKVPVYTVDGINWLVG